MKKCKYCSNVVYDFDECMTCLSEIHRIMRDHNISESEAIRVFKANKGLEKRKTERLHNGVN